jgi:hypothetical protein
MTGVVHIPRTSLAFTLQISSKKVSEVFIVTQNLFLNMLNGILIDYS